MNLSEQQVIAVIHATRPLQPNERTAFLTALETLLVDRSDIGDGELFRALRDLQHKHFKSPTKAEVGGPDAGKKRIPDITPNGPSSPIVPNIHRRESLPRALPAKSGPSALPRPP